MVRSDVPRAQADGSEATAAARAANDVGFDLYRVLATEDSNLIFSPASIAFALGMVRSGARGSTAVQFDDVLHGVASDAHANWLNSLDQALAERSGTFTDRAGDAHEVRLETANAWFGQSGLTFEDAFLEALASRYGAGMRLVDFAGNPAAVERLINEWASEQTHGRIPKVLDPGTVTAQWRLALANAIYLKAAWLEPFDPDATRAEAFTLPDGSTVDVPMMTGRLGTCATGDDWQAVRLPYVGEGLSLLVIVPERLAAFEARLDSDLLAEIVGAFEARYALADVTLPRFDIETKVDLVPDLKALGLTVPFGSSADFSGMTAEAQLAIGTVIHQANITVDEAGTEAAAVTVVGLDTSGGPTPTCTVSADRPFVFALQDNDTGAILFAGHVVDPSATRD